MKKRMLLILLIVLFSFIHKFSYCQVWERTYTASNHAEVEQLRGSYDKGYLLESIIVVGSIGRIGWILKTDINGNVLWEKKIGNGIRLWVTEGMDNTSDGGLILVGHTDTLHYSLDRLNPFIMKLDACGNTEWCRIYCPGNENYDLGNKIVTLPDNSYTALFILWLNGSNYQTPWLFHVDETGSIIWEQIYMHPNSLLYPYWSNSLCLTPENNILITGTCYAKDTVGDSLYWTRPALILSDSSGEAVWEVPWKITPTFVGEGYQSISSRNSFYSAIREYKRPPDTSLTAPSMIKTSNYGIPVSNKKLVTTFAYGNATTITKVSDTTFFIGVGYCTGSEYCTNAVFNVDTLGNVRKQTVFSHSQLIPVDAILTTDNKYLITQNDYLGSLEVIKLWKLNEHLEFDSIYTRPFTYDSLCPHPITSSTLSFQCDVVTGIQESAINTEKVKMIVFPNPGHNNITVKLPECIQKESETEHFKVITVFHKWSKDLTLQIFDIYGRQIYTQQIKPSDKEISFNVSIWSSGIYFFRLVYNNIVVASEKFVKD